MSTVLERGDVFFFYRPRVGREQARGLEDVQRFFVVLEPDGRRRWRRLVVGRKRLPDPDRHEREWAFVAEVADDVAQLRDDLERVEYETRTRGRRVQPEARPAGEGRYALVDHDGHTHLAYALELPHEPGEVQRTLGIRRQASYIVAVRNPEAPAPPGLGLRRERRANLPPELRERLGGRRFAPVEPPELLDQEGVELVLIGAAEDASSELGIELDAERERLACSDFFQLARLRPLDLPTTPLTRGEWR
jgi:hypothetical protein